ncbi:MAG: M16 family metallopeptidase [Prevotella sp.]
MTVAIGQQGYVFESVEGDLMDTRIYRLQNGLTVYLSPNKEKPRVQAYIAVRTGSRNDPSETTGLAHYLEHIMFKGSTSFGTVNYAEEKPYLDQIEAKYEIYRTLKDSGRRKNCYREIDSLSQLASRYFIPNEYDKMMASIGAQGSNAYTSFDVTNYLEDIPSNEIENWLRIESERFQNMVIRGFHTELEAVYEEYNIYTAMDEENASNAFLALAFPGHPYGTQTTIGTQEHLKNPSITNIKNYFSRYYVPNNVAICMAGDFDPDDVIPLVDRYFGTWKPNPALSRPEYPAIEPDKTVRDSIVWGKESESLLMGWRFKGAADLQSDTLDVIAKMLANGKAGLFEINLEQQMKALGVSCFNLALKDYSVLWLHGTPKSGQPLEELRDLIAGEISKLRTGDFPDDLLPSVVANMKLEYYQSLLSNENRADMFVDAFINGKEWRDVVGKLERVSKLKKSDIVTFANTHFKDNYFCVFKKQGEAVPVKKIEKPAITPIPANRELSSAFLNEMNMRNVKPIEPRFVDFQRDMSVLPLKGKTKGNVMHSSLLYKHNNDDGLFSLSFVYPLGTENIKGLDLIPEYLYYIGTDKKTSADIKQAFYRLACNYSVRVSSDEVRINLTGLNENLKAALQLLEEFLHHAHGDSVSYGKFVELMKKSREDAKKDQRDNFTYLRNYGIYGDYNPKRNTFSNRELESAGPRTLLDMLKQVLSMPHDILYFGPSPQQHIVSLLAKVHKTATRPQDIPEAHKYIAQPTQCNEIYFAPYDAQNIYMMQYHNEKRSWNPEEAALKAVFNEYFGGSMNSVVFQELREARALAYSASAYYNQPVKASEPESFYTYIISQNDKMIDCITTFNQILDTIPQSETAVEIAKQSLKKTLESRRVTREAVLNSYLSARRMGIDYDINKRIYEQLPTITLSDLVEFERTNMSEKPLRYIILGKEEELDLKALEKTGQVKRLTTDEIFGF